jgi:formylglycine-generating enzyme required for sulfatase activity
MPTRIRKHLSSLFVASAVACLSAATSAQPTNLGDRALVIGNDSYHSSLLHNAVNDALDIAKSLTDLGYDVTLATNVNSVGLETAVSSFIGHIVPGDRVVVFYAGHGVQEDAENYLIPVDFTPAVVEQIRMQAYPLSRLMHLLSHAAPSVQVMIFDACRDNPFQDHFSLKRGWKMVENTTANSYIAFSAAPGGLAGDDSGRGRNGLFTSYLLDELRVPGLTIDQMFSSVRKQVYAASGAEQLPWTSSSLLGDTYLAGPQVMTPVGVNAELYTTAIRQSELEVSQDSRPRLQVVTRHDITPESEVVNRRENIIEPSRTAGLPNKDIIRRAGRSLGGLEYVLIPTGMFLVPCSTDVQCENRGRVITIDQPFWMGRTEVTVKAYLDAMQQNGLRSPASPSFNDQWHLTNHPIVNVSLEDAARFCSFVGGRLPSNDEWEYSAAAGARTSAIVAHDAANYGNEVCCGGLISGRDKWEYTSPVGSFPPNGFGLYDMLGNVWEWVLSEPEAKPSGSESAFLRGGSWIDSSWYLRTSYRRTAAANNSFRNAGFRCLVENRMR